MNEWKIYKLGDLYCEPSKNGLMKPSIIRGEGYKMVNMKEIFSYDRMFNIPMERVPISEKEERFFLKSGDLLFARQSLVVSGAGKCSIFLHDNEPVVFESHLIRTRFDRVLVDPNYLYYYFKSPVGRNKIESIVEFTAAAGIRGSDLSKIEISIPNLAAQSAIAQILSSFDDKIELNLQMNQTLEAMAQALFKEWFVNFNFPGFDGELVDGLPKGWRMGKMGEIVDFKNGKTSPERTENGFYPVYGANGVIGFADNSNAEERITIIGRVGSFCGSTYFEQKKSWVTDNAIIAKSKVPSSIFIFLKLNNLKLNSLRAGSGQPLLNQSILSEINTVIPNDEFCFEFEKIVLPIFEKIEMNNQQIACLTQTRDTLLPKLMSGKIKIDN